MRTTLTLEDDLVKKLKRIALDSGRTFEDVVNTTLRRGIDCGERGELGLSPFRVEAKACGFRTGVDRNRLNQIYDGLRTEDFRRQLRREIARVGKSAR